MRPGKQPVTERLGRFVDSDPFQHGVLAVIVMAAVLVGLETSRDLVASHGPLLHTLDQVVLAIFALAPASFGAAVYAVPILGNALAMREAIQGQIDWLALALLAGVNALGFALLTWCSIRLYGRESVLFRV